MSIVHPDPEILDNYALGCLEEAEARDVGEHVRGCAACQKLMAETENLLGDLAVLVAPMDPPPDLENSVMRGLPSVPSPFGVRRMNLRQPVALAAVAVLLIALAAGNVAQWLAHPAPKSRQIVGLTLIVLVGRSGSADAYGTVVLDPVDNGGVLAVRGLARLDATHVYQLWMVRNREARSGGTFTVSEDGYGNLLLQVPKDFRDFSSVAISREPLGGSSTPSGEFVAEGIPARP